jgi:peptidoglycan/xylan/chitin deacetylase (PgdA/CDA1 family)
MKKKISRKIHVKKQHLVVLLLVLFLLIGIFILFLYKTQSALNSLKPVVESQKTEMKKLPPAMQKKLETASPSATFRVPIFLYHYVEYVRDKRDTIRQKLDITPYTFEQELITLQKDGYTFMTAKELGDVLDGKTTLPPKPILLTFDDGHRDFYTDVLPLLKKYTIKATAYIIPGFTGGSDFMTQQQIKEVIDSGLVDVGAHTIHHISLKGRPAALVQNEVAGSKQMLEQTYGIKVVSFAYPNGAFDEQAANIVKNAGFSTSVSTIPGVDVNQANRFFIYRIRPGGRTGQNLLNYLQT